MTEERRQMDLALKRIVVRRLREMGFKGSMPHFRRVRGDLLDLLSFQFDRYGGSFCVEVASAPAAGLQYTPDWFVPAEKLDVGYTRERLRLGAPEGLTDRWFEFGPRSFEPAQPLPSPSRFEAVAEGVASLLDKEAEPWWRSR